MNTRSLVHIIESVPTSDGAGVKLRRSLGSQPGMRVDPFLMLDEFYSDNPDDYISGFPSHPHRGFETVTYMLDGHMRHEDHLGNRGNLGPGDVQWMTAARGIIHSEMPQQSAGRMRGFQLWLNLPSKEKMKPAHYRDIPVSEIPLIELPRGGEVKVIAGTLNLEGDATNGPINGSDNKISTDPLYLDVRLPPGAEFSAPITTGHNAFLYAYEGSARIGTAGAAKPLPHRTAGVLSDGDSVRVQAGAEGVRFLLLAARPIHEPVVQYGPFVMNTREEIEQALADYRGGRLAVAAGG
ncbi:MAG: quercetin 2,3-dioxygenase [Gammaproteobacteria bacterium]|jgi:redox-sensitive bicupin YhaK (pirin superfamily)|nr:quercetin 2,3-dioxygenase [Gammaproteobacteria bacterium]